MLELAPVIITIIDQLYQIQTHKNKKFCRTIFFIEIKSDV